MRPEREHAVLILGGGLAAMASACVFARAGWHVHLRCEGAQHDYLPAGVATPAAMRRLERLTGAHLPGWRIGPVLELDGCGRRLTRMGAVLCVRTLRDTLADHVGKSCKVKAIRSHRGSELHHKCIDLVVEPFDGDRVACWADTSHHVPLPWAIHWRGSQSGSALLACDSGGHVSLAIAPADNRAPHPESVLDALLLEAGAEWARRIGDLCLKPRSSRHCPSAGLPVAAADPIPDVPKLRIDVCRPGQFMADLITQLEVLSVLLEHEAAPLLFSANTDVQSCPDKPITAPQPMVQRSKQRVAA